MADSRPELRRNEEARAARRGGPFTADGGAADQEQRGFGVIEPPDPVRAEAAAELVGKEPPSPSRPARSGETVTVCCNLPNGLLMRVFAKIRQPVATPTGVVFEDLWQARRGPGDTHIIKGNAIDIEGALHGHSSEFAAVHGYVLTPGIPRDFYELWYEQNKDSDYVRNKSVFAVASEARAREVIKAEVSGLRSGLEPIDPTNPTSKAPELRGLGGLAVAPGERG
jgi:hypothetical protein